MHLTPAEILPQDPAPTSLVGRVWMGGDQPGPRPFVLRDGMMIDLSKLAPTTSALFDLPELAASVSAHQGEALGTLEEALGEGRLLAPCDLQAIKASGVTFAGSLLERVLEERARGEPERATEVRQRLREALPANLAELQPGSAQAQEARHMLEEAGLWSQYLEVGIGPDAEIFTKAQPMSAVGCGAAIGVRRGSQWSSSEPEVVLAVASNGRVVGASLGNDMSLRDLEGRSALLLTRAKDNNASCAIGPMVRLFDGEFSLDDVRRADVRLHIRGPDGFEEAGASRMTEISRDPLDLVAATIGRDHQYPDGMVLFLGTMYVPGSDRNGPGSGFTHRPGDIVSVSSPRLGALVNEVADADQAPPWDYGVRALAASLAARGLL